VELTCVQFVPTEVNMSRIYKRKNIWYLDIRHNGLRIRKKVGKSKRIAELALKDAELKIERDEFDFERKDMSIEELISHFIDYKPIVSDI
jgi:hypothetical protein